MQRKAESFACCALWQALINGMSNLNLLSEGGIGGSLENISTTYCHLN